MRSLGVISDLIRFLRTPPEFRQIQTLTVRELYGEIDRLTRLASHGDITEQEVTRLYRCQLARDTLERVREEIRLTGHIGRG